MKLQVTQANLAKALNIVSKIASIRTQMPILDNILLKTEGNRLLIASTNLEIAITQYIGAKITKPGSITVPARIMTEFVNSLPQDIIDLKLEQNHLQITCKKFSSTINGTDAEEFPDLPTINKDESTNLVFDADIFKQAISQTIVAVSNDISRPEFTGMLWRSIDKQLYFVATDVHRLVEKKVIKVEQDLSIVIPAQTLSEVVRVIDNQVNQVEVLFNDSQIRFLIDDTEIISQLIDKNYLDYRKIIPQDYSTVVEINKSDFAKVVKISSYFSLHSSSGITITADDEKQELIFKSVASEIGENNSQIEAVIKGQGVISLNAKYLSDALSNIDGDKIEFKFNNKMTPCVLKPADKKDHIHIIMPLKS